MGKIIGVFLVVAAVGLAAKMVAGRGPLFPHLVGPSVLAIAGVLLLIF